MRCSLIVKVVMKMMINMIMDFLDILWKSIKTVVFIDVMTYLVVIIIFLILYVYKKVKHKR